MFFDARHLGHVSKKIVASLKKRFGEQSAAARFLEISRFSPQCVPAIPADGAWVFRVPTKRFALLLQRPSPAALLA